MIFLVNASGNLENHDDDDDCFYAEMRFVFFAMIIMNIRMDSIVECYTVTNMFLLCYIDDHFFARYIPFHCVFAMH